MKKIINLFLGILTILILLNGCKDNESDSINKNDTLVITGNTHINKIIYYDFVPDTVIEAKQYEHNYYERESFDIDVNKDLKNDLKITSYAYDFSYGSAGGCGAKIEIIDSLTQIANFKNDLNIISLGDTIDIIKEWKSKEVVLVNRSGPPSDIYDAFSDKTFYIGLKMSNKYGWIKMKVDVCRTVTIYDFLIEK